MDLATEERTLEFAFSSETPVDRWFGDEVLSHDAGAADLSRLNDAAPLLWNHNRDDMIGVVEKAWMGADKRGYAKVRFGTSAKADEILSDVRAGIIRNVSFGYQINEMVERVADGKSTYTATRWQPLEISLVSIPADNSVGLGRSETEETREVVVRGIAPKEEVNTMTDIAPAQPVDVSAVRAEAVSAERARIDTINKLGERFENADLARQLVEGGRSIEEARSAFLDSIGAKQKPVDSGNSGVVDMSEREQRDYSVVRAINAAIARDWSKAGLELEASRELAKQLGRDTEGFFMPTNLRTAYNVGTATQGGNLVATNLMAGSFIEVLRNKALMMSLGATTMTGLVGNVAIPRQTSQTQTYWVAEGSDLTEAEALFDQVTLSPKQIGALSQYSRLALQQTTPDIEAVVRNDLARVMALGIDSAIINGSGSSGQPRGILNTSGIGSVAMGTNGAAFVNGSASTSPSGLDQLIDLEGKLDIANALEGDLVYVTNAKVVSALKKLKDQYGGYLWTNDRDSTVQGTQGMINGYGVARTNQVPSNLTKGSGSSLSAMLFLRPSEVIVGMWGGLEVLPNPYGSGYKSGAVDIRAMQTCDVSVRHPASFAAITDIIA